MRRLTIYLVNNSKPKDGSTVKYKHSNTFKTTHSFKNVEKRHVKEIINEFSDQEIKKIQYGHELLPIPHREIKAEVVQEIAE